MKKTMKIEMAAGGCCWNEIFYAMLALPAMPHEIQDARHKLRITPGMDTNLRMEICSCEILPELVDVRLDSPSIEEMNFFAQRLAQLSDSEAIALRGVWQQMEKTGYLEEPVRAMDLINMTYGLETVMVASNVTNDYELGEFVLDGELDDELIRLSERVIELLDMEAVGRWHRESQQGQFVGKYYVVAGDYQLHQIYDGRTLPPTEQAQPFVFRLQVAESPVDDSMENLESAEWISLPIARDEADEIARKHCEGCIEDCFFYGFESSIPQITAEQYGDMRNFVLLNGLAHRITEMKPADVVKFKAVLEAEQPKDMCAITDIANHLREYQLETRAGDVSQFFREYLLRQMHPCFDDRRLDTMSTSYDSQKILERLGASVTDYGVVSGRGRQLYEMVPYEQKIEQEIAEPAEQGMTLGGM